MMSIKIKTISMVRIPPPKCRKYLFHVALTKKHRNFDTMGIKVAVLLQKRMNDSDARSSTPGPSTGTGGDLQVPNRA